jgi:hypothetical protein
MKQLFIGHLHIVERMGGVRQVLNQPKKYKGNPLIEGDKPWEHWEAELFGGSVRYDDEEKKFKMWYNSHDERPNPGHPPHIICYATSKDGIHWETPELGVIEYEGNKKNNIVFMGELYALNSNVIKDPLDIDPNRRYKMIYVDWGRGRRGYGLYAAFSPDGIHWTTYEKNPVITGVGDTHQLMGWDPKLGKWVAAIRPDEDVIPPRRIIGRSESEDFIHWTKPTHILVQDDMDPLYTELYGMPMMQYEDIYVGILWILHEDPKQEDQTIYCQLTYSVDGVTWQRDGHRDIFLPPGPRGSWDSGMVFPIKPLIVGDEIWIYYGGYNIRHHTWSTAPFGELQEGCRVGGCVGLAKLRLDGFVSLDAGDEGGYVVTRPFALWASEGNGAIVEERGYARGPIRIRPYAKRLVLNAEAKNGEVRVELLDANAEDQVIPGFSREECDRFNGDSVRHTVTWNGGQDLSSLMGKSFKLKFYLRNAKLYSFQLEK